MEEKDRKEHQSRVKKSLYSNGLKCMFTSALLLILMFIFCIDGQNGIKYLPEDMFWLFQKIVTGAFILGAVSYLMSLAIKEEQE